MNFADSRRIRWDFNERVKESDLQKILKEFEEIKNSSSVIDIIDLHKINPNAYTIPNEDFQVKYKI